MKRQLTAGIAGGVLLLLACIWNEPMRECILEAGERCLTVLIPSLYFYSLLAAFCIRSGGLRAVSSLFGKYGVIVGILLFSQIGGYPVGAQLLQEMTQNGILEPRQAKRMQCICFGCGPGFLLGTVCRGFPLRLTLWMMLSVILPNLLLAPLVLRGCEMKAECSPHIPLSRQITQAAESAANAMLKVTAMILAFAALIGILEGMGVFTLLPEQAAAELRAVLEVSCVTELMPAGGSLPFAAACLSFGGICVHFQIAALSGGELNWAQFWLIRLTASVMSGGICLLGIRYLLSGCVPASLPVVQPQLTTGSILPGACLLLMSVLLLRRASPEDAL